MKKYALVLYYFFCFSSIPAQVLMNKDSLLKLLPTAKQDSSLVLLYINIGQQYEISSDLETAKSYYLKARDLSEKLHYRMGSIKYISNYTYILNVQEKTDSSLILNKQALELAKEIGDPLTIAKCYANIGSSFFHMDIFDSALVNYQNSRALIEVAADPEMMARIDDITQNIYYKMGQYGKAVEMSESALKYYRTSKDSVSLGIVLSNLGNNYVSLGKYAKGLNIFKEALAIARSIEYPELQQTLLLNIGNIFVQEQLADSIKPYMEESLRLASKLKLPESESAANRGLALYALFKRDFPLARESIEKAVALSRQFNSTLELAKNLETFSSVLYAMNKIEDAEKMLKESGKLRDSISGNEIQKQIVIAEKRFETQKKENQIKLQDAIIHQKNILNYFLIGGSVALMVILSLSYRNYRHRQRIQQHRISELETEKQLTVTEAVLKGEEQERTRLARDLHDGLGGMLSGIKYSMNHIKGNLIMTAENAEDFERSIDMIDSSIREMRRVAHNMMPESLIKFGLNTALKDFCNEITQSGAMEIHYESIDVSDALFNQTTTITLYRIIQELVNNAIKHSGATKIIVQLSRSKQLINVTVEDNGRGFDVEILNHSEGIGWNNVRHRVDFLKGKIDLHSTSGEGTSVSIEFEL